MSNWQEIDTYVKHWIKEAGERIRQSFKMQLNIQTKSNRNDLVTNVDQETEQFFIERIRSNFPDHQILGEEGYGDDLKDMKGTIWIIDPIDGTMNFVHQQRNFAISIGIYQDGEGVLGYIYDVVHDELYHAHKGHGAYMNDLELQPLKEVEIRDSIIGVNALWVTDNNRIDRDVLGPLVRDVRGTRSYGSAAMEMAYVASGRIDGYMTMRLAPWDFAAGKILIEEVGGVVTSLDGNELNMLKKSSVFSCKPGLHGNILNTYLKDVKLNK
ncbi:inositol monophosphatase family protein [Bacillus sp. SCS-153A]|uniref:inositol monophosphatase family protein n=1 Tax=Rossellomorea sedimentorum TaxID=3115294 RepID=UPI003905A281